MLPRLFLSRSFFRGAARVLSRSLHASPAVLQREVKTKAKKEPKRADAVRAPPDTAGEDADGGDGADDADGGKDKSLSATLSRHVEYARRELSKLRGAAVSPALLDHVSVDAYGDRTPLSEVAQISLKGAGALVVNPYDAALVDAIVEAIRDADVGVTPTAEGDLVRVAVPKPSKETREAAVKLVSKIAEAAKTRVRRARAAELDKLKKAALPPDDAVRESKLIEETVSGATQDIAKLADTKRVEIEKGQ